MANKKQASKRAKRTSNGEKHTCGSCNHKQTVLDSDLFTEYKIDSSPMAMSLGGNTGSVPWWAYRCSNCQGTVLIREK